jgi:hypothetical protein
MCVCRVALVRAVSSRCPCPTVRCPSRPRGNLVPSLQHRGPSVHATDRPHHGNLAVVLPTPRPRGNLFPSLQHRGPSVHATGRPHHAGGMHCSSWLSEVRPAGPPRLCGRGGRCGSGSSGISGAGTRTYGVGTGGGCVCSTRGHVGVWQGGGNQGSISAAGCSGRVTDVGGQVTRPRGATRPPRAQTSSLARAGLAYRSMGSTCTCS